MFANSFEKTAFDFATRIMPAVGATMGATIGGETDMQTGETKNRWIGGLRGATASLAGILGHRGARKMGAGLPLSILADFGMGALTWKALSHYGPQYDREKLRDMHAAQMEMERFNKTAGFSLSGLHKSIKPAVQKNVGHVDPAKNLMPRPGGKPKYTNSLINPAKLKGGKPKLGYMGNAKSIRGANQGVA